MSNARLATDFWVAAKLRQVQNAGGYASVLVKGNSEAGAINLVLRDRDGWLSLAVPSPNLAELNVERCFEWRESDLDDQTLKSMIEREMRFDRDQWFVEVECSRLQFEDIFEIRPV